MKQQEIWKDIPSYEGLYQASNLGVIKSLPRVNFKVNKGKFNGQKVRRVLKERFLSQTNNGGYRQVTLYKDSKSKVCKVHTLVAMAFLGHVQCGMDTVIDHINNIKDDNRVENLQLITQRRNISKDRIKGTSIYKGVILCKQTKLWKCTIGIKDKIIFIGNFHIELEAAYYYQKALNLIHKYKGCNKEFRNEVFKYY